MRKATKSPTKKTSKTAQRVDKLPTYKELAAWQLRHLGYTIEQTAQMLQIGTTAVKDYDRKMSAVFAEMPAIQLAIDTMRTMIPRAVEVYREALHSCDQKLAKDTAKDILISHKVLIDRHEVLNTDDAKRPDAALIAEAERLLALARGDNPAVGDNDRTASPPSRRTLSLPDPD